MVKPKYRFELEKYSGSRSKHTCPKCNKKGVFVRYIDTETYNYINTDVGRCDRLFECGYHHPPREYFAKNGYLSDVFKNSKSQYDIPFKARYQFRIDEDKMYATLKASQDNNLVKYLMGNFNPQQVDEVIIKYRVGTSDKWPGATIFWQIDKKNEIRTGKIMLYDENTGKRVKKPYNHIAWMHTPYLDFNCEAKQCLFGEHLLAKDSDSTVGVVESEKTAIIASLFCPEYIWVSVGSANNLNPTFCGSLKDRRVILYPDADAYSLWKEKAGLLSKDMDVTVSDDLQRDTDFVNSNKGADLADYFLMFQSSF